MKLCRFCNQPIIQRDNEKNYQFVRRFFCHKGCARKFNIGSIKERIERRYVPEPNSGCWLWTGSVSSWGYGSINIGGKIYVVSRLSWEIYRGPIPDGMKVLHLCDTPACINPDHLFLGTDRDNNHDMIRKGRHIQLKGTELPQSKLSEADVLAIRQSREGTVSLAKRYGINRTGIRKIIRRITWKHI